MNEKSKSKTNDYIISSKYHNIEKNSIIVKYKKI